MESILSQIVFLSAPVSGEDFNIERFMAQNGLIPSTIDSVVNRRFFTVSSNLYYVSIQSGKLIVSDKRDSGLTKLYSYPSTKQTSYRVGNINYIGTNHGEFGGNLVVVVNGQSKELMKGNIVHLLPIDDKLYIIEGLGHFDVRHGSVNVIPNKFKPTTPQRIAEFYDVPRFGYVDKAIHDHQAAVIVCESSLMVLKPNDHLENFQWDGFKSFSPITSLVRYNNYYFFGLPHGVAVTPSLQDSQKLTFYGDTELQEIIQSCIIQAVEEQPYFDEIKRLAWKGDSKAQIKLGAMYICGIGGMPEDFKRAVYWYTKAAEQGDSEAQFELGNMYEMGYGVPEDYKQAIYWYSKAAQQGYASAEHALWIKFLKSED